MDPSQEGHPLLPLPPPNPGPRDKYNIIYIIFYILGTGTLLPWNFFTTAKSYFMYKLRNTSLPADVDYSDPRFQTPLQYTFESYLAIAAMVPGVLFIFLNTTLTRHVRLQVRMISSLVSILILFLITIALVKVDTDEWQFSFFIVTLSSVVFINASSGLMQGCLFGLASMFPAKYTNAVMAGQGLGGIFAAVANIAAISGTPDPTDSGFGYFMTAEVVLLISLIAYLLLPYSKFAKFHLTKCARPPPRKVLVTPETDSLAPLAQLPAVPVRPPRTHVPMVIILRRVWPMGLSVFLDFFVTLSLFPAIISSINSQNKDDPNDLWADKYFIPVVCFLFYNTGDFLGRLLGGIIRLPRTGSGVTIPLASIIRLAFIPLFMLCNVQPRQYLPVVFHHDAYPIVLMIVFSLSNGYIGALCMMYGPKSVRMEDAETAGSMMSFFISAGLCCGALFSMGLTRLL